MKKIFFFLIAVIAFAAAHAQADTTLKQFTGKYNFPAGSVVSDVTVILDGTALTMTSSAGTSDLTKAGIDSFNVVAFQGIAAFKRDSNNKIIGVIIDAMGYHLEGAKEAVTATSFIFRKEGISELKRQESVIR